MSDLGGKTFPLPAHAVPLRANCPMVAEQEMQVCHGDSLQSTVRAATVLRPDSLQCQSKKHKTKHEMGMRMRWKWEKDGTSSHCCLSRPHWKAVKFDDLQTELEHLLYLKTNTAITSSLNHSTAS